MTHDDVQAGDRVLVVDTCCPTGGTAKPRRSSSEGRARRLRVTILIELVPDGPGNGAGRRVRLAHYA